MASTTRAAAFVALLLSTAATAHEDHMDKIEEGHAISGDPIDSILWIHILIQSLAWGIIFPTGMVLGIIRSKWHVPVQTVGSLLAIVGFFLGHKHKGRQFSTNMHAKFVPYIMLMLVAQVAMGVYLKLHLERGINAKIRKVVIKIHGVVGKALPLVTWVQFVFGGITALGFCRADHTGQCLAHFIMGGAFIAYGIILIILLLVGQDWLRRTGRSQEFFDSLVIAAWGCVNTFTEHRWGKPWAGNDLQHTSMGVIWWAAGLVGVWLSRTRGGRPKRNLIPGIVIFVTGWAMSAHPQHLPISTMIHTVFGYTLMAAGAARIIEISFVLKDSSAISADGSDPNSFQYLTPFLLIAGGFMFMGATEEQMQLLADAHVTHVSYVLILLSIAFLLFLFVNMLLHLYAVHAWGQDIKADAEAPRMNGLTNGHANGQPNGYARANSRVRDAEEFELEGLDSEDEDDDVLDNKERRPLVAQH
ncbi:integral membrane protein-like protein [Cucurbitaria berberidis CBS 394.84]|uniref:Integral membrane protein-like protein n=1 Tax=Cucurbitaria berberidis CBS 394.84 TaxID=1168544 RepID=A0A9P4LE08_9PLEO|nr:integral membrane protein-like protein [Cucurbitaria berberidis CBS 394.84]KAF1850927.1 integral membrane protein-like protein [Cucurbitaria berberidis CBS 394.84]